MIKRVKAPVRIDFAGGTTDIAPFTHIGGAVLNAAINHYIKGELIATDKKVGLKYYADIPTNSGLGTSGAMNVVWLALITRIKNKIELAEKAYKLEQAIGFTGGKQDQYTAALGGINFLEFKDEKVKITKLNLKKSTIKELEDSLLLHYTGKPHFSTNINKAMINNFVKGKNVDSLLRIRNIAKEMKSTLKKNDLNKFAELLNEEFKERKKLSSKVTNQKINKLINFGLMHGAIAAKLCGAGGGGSILFYCKNKSKLMKELDCIDFKFDFKGLQWY
ncbi:MAG: hypothetical protein AABW46_03835 [Nanoarchaeota archaeon]